MSQWTDGMTQPFSPTNSDCPAPSARCEKEERRESRKHWVRSCNQVMSNSGEVIRTWQSPHDRLLQRRAKHKGLTKEDLQVKIVSETADQSLSGLRSRASPRPSSRPSHLKGKQRGQPDRLCRDPAGARRRGKDMPRRRGWSDF